jgi:hypothetical protein
VAAVGIPVPVPVAPAVPIVVPVTPSVAVLALSLPAVVAVLRRRRAVVPHRQPQRGDQTDAGDHEQDQNARTPERGQHGTGMTGAMHGSETSGERKPVDAGHMLEDQRVLRKVRIKT